MDASLNCLAGWRQCQVLPHNSFLKIWRLYVGLPQCHGSAFKYWVPHTAGIFQARTHKSDIPLAFDTLRVGVKVGSEENQLTLPTVFLTW